MPILRQLGANLLKGIGLALVIATGFSAWVTAIRLLGGTAPFERNGTTYDTAVTVYYAGGLIGGPALLIT